jgi:predicted Rossmann fold nucleotide-binding protein DprA/Smf involved in DNA uptake
MRTLRPLLLRGAEADQIAEWARKHLSPKDAMHVEANLAAGPETADALDELAESGVRCLLFDDPEYPARWRERLGSLAPLVVFVAGEASLPSGRCIGVVGSRECSPDALEVARWAGETVALSGATLVSGGARGVDSASAEEALRFGGACVVVVSHALVRHCRSLVVAPESGEGRVCLASVADPYAGFSVWEAMARNKLVYALGGPTLVVTAALGAGGTWEGAVEALRLGLGPVLVWLGPGAGPGNQALVEKGAHGITDMAELVATDFDAPAQSALF